MSTRFTCDDTETLVAYIYGEVDPALDASVVSHLSTCAACRAEVDALGGVRRALGAWAPPAPALRYSIVSEGAASSAPARSSAWTSVPVWAQLAAACLALGVSAAVANVQVRREAGGWTMTTGWMTPPATTEVVPAPAAADWRPALVALEQSLRQELSARPADTATVATPSSAGVDQATLVRVRSLIQESERRQQQELALRLTQFSRDVDLQRRADLVRINQGFGQLEGRTGAEVARQREMLDYIVRAGLRPQQ